MFFPPAEFLVTTRITRVGERAVQDRRQGAGQRRAGSRSTARKLQDEDANARRRSQQGEKVKTREVEVDARNQTRPPARFNEATLLSAMEGAGKLIEDDELREAMAEKGLGTPATRAAIIEGLIDEKYVQREGRELVPTAKAFSLMFAAARHFGVD